MHGPVRLKYISLIFKFEDQISDFCILTYFLVDESRFCLTTNNPYFLPYIIFDFVKSMNLTTGFQSKCHMLVTVSATNIIHMVTSYIQIYAF